MEYMLFSTEKYIFFQSRNPGIWAFPIPVFGIEKNVRDPCILDPGITIPTRNWCVIGPLETVQKRAFSLFPQVKNHQLLCARQYWCQ